MSILEVAATERHWKMIYFTEQVIIFRFLFPSISRYYQFGSAVTIVSRSSIQLQLVSVEASFSRNSSQWHVVSAVTQVSRSLFQPQLESVAVRFNRNSSQSQLDLAATRVSRS